MQDRSEYFRQYRASHRTELVKTSREYYQANKRKALTYQRNYYILHKAMLLTNAKKRDQSLLGHAAAIYKAIKKYAKEWHLPVSDWNEFKEWAMSDSGYEARYNEWRGNSYSGQFSPVVMRLVKKNGFVVGNLDWKLKGDYSWWSEEKALRDIVEKDLEQLQNIRNKRDKEWRDKVKKQWKEKKKQK